MKSIICTFLFVGFLFSKLFSQHVIELNNPSFEDAPRKGGHSTMPIKGWQDCGKINFASASSPDIHPVVPPAWEVTMKAWDGSTYLGLVTRDNGERESVSQKLTSPMEKVNAICCQYFWQCRKHITVLHGNQHSYKISLSLLNYLYGVEINHVIMINFYALLMRLVMRIGNSTRLNLHRIKD